MRVQQIELRPWRSGERWPIAELTLLPEALAERYGLVFDKDFDNLDYFQFAAIELGDGTQVLLQHYPSMDDHGAYVWVDSAADFDVARAHVLQALDLSPSDFRWVSPYPIAPEEHWLPQRHHYPDWNPGDEYPPKP